MKPHRKHLKTILVGSHTSGEVEIVLVNTTSQTEAAYAAKRAEHQALA